MFNHPVIQPPFDIERLHNDTLGWVFSFLRQIDLIHVSRVNQRFYSLSCLDSVVKTAGSNYSADSLLYSYIINKAYTRRSVAVLPDKQIAIGGKSGIISIWDYDKEKIVTKFSGLGEETDEENPEILCLAHLGQDQIISTVFDKTIRIYNYKTAQLLRTCKFDNSIRCVTALNDNQVALGNYAGKIFILDINTFQESEKFWVGMGRHQRMCKLPNDELVVVCDNGSVQIYNWKNLSLVKTLCPAMDEVYRIIGGEVFCSDVLYLGDDKIATSHQDGLRIWNYKTGELLFLLRGERVGMLRFGEGEATNPYPYECSAIVRVNQDKIACSRPGSIEIWNVNTGKLLQKMDDHRRVLSYTLHA